MKARWDPGAVGNAGRLAALARLVRIEHTLFSLPFAYAGALLAGIPGVYESLLIFTAVLGLRTAAMAYNNIADMDIDAKNPRTAKRPLLTGAVSLRDAWLLVALGSLTYYLSAALLNQCAALLSPILWLIAITYPHAKRIHCLPHIHLGLALGMVVFGGYVAVAGGPLSLLPKVVVEDPWLFVAAVTLWVAGFDTLYATMDAEFDRVEGLGSIPACFGEGAALKASVSMEAAAAALFICAACAYTLNVLYLASAAVAVLLLAAQFVLYLRGDTRGAFNVNLAVGVIVASGVIAARLLSL